MEPSAILLDTSVLINFFRKKNKSKSFLYKLIPHHSFYISVITDFEIKIGSTTERHSQDYQILMTNINLLLIDQPCIDKAVEIYNNLKRQNILIELADLLIGGATAIHNSLPLATLNIKHFKFKRIDELSFVNLSLQ